MTIDDLREWLAVLRANPDWKAEVRREVLSEELLSLPDLIRQNGEDIRELKDVVRQNSEDIKQNSADIRQNSVDIRELREIVRQNSADIRALREIVQQNSVDIRALQEIVQQNSEDIRGLKDIVRQNSEDIRKNSADISRLSDSVDKLLIIVTKVDGRLGSAEGFLAEMRWIDKFPARFGRLVNRGRRVLPDDLDAFYTAFDQGTLSDDDANAVRELDIIIQGVQGKGDSKVPVLIAVEVSIRLEVYDLLRVLERSAILQRLGYHVVPVHAGAIIGDELNAQAQANGVEVLLKPGDILYPVSDMIRDFEPFRASQDA